MSQLQFFEDVISETSAAANLGTPVHNTIGEL